MPKTHNKTGRSRGRERYVELPHYVLKSFAWRCLTVNARCAWLELMEKYYPGLNGKIVMSARVLGERLNCSHSTASRALNELVTYGFVEVAKASSFGRKRLAKEYRMTHLKCDTTDKLPAKVFLNIQAPSKPKPKLKIVHSTRLSSVAP